MERTDCARCDNEEDGEARYSLGLYAGRMCDTCWNESGYRKEGKEGFDPSYAGECYEPEDY